MKQKCAKCGRLVRSKKTWHHDPLGKRKWCLASPGCVEKGVRSKPAPAE